MANETELFYLVLLIVLIVILHFTLARHDGGRSHGSRTKFEAL